MKKPSATPLFLAVLLSIALPNTSVAKTIVASSSELDISTLSSEKRFETATITITGPNGFEKQFILSGNDTELDLGQLGITQDGNYSYQIEYAQPGKVETINDPRTGRSGSKRNLGKVETKSGYFNVKDSEFVHEEYSEGLEKAEEIDTNNFEIVDENLGK
ncbi:hypothetical protein [Shewanella woodyi]|uniref:Uncharacterized protein n=1 Tax=Shewanella woodyi (strain ATCC 51908 / MS32) TaxID=392500 RepID=B1KMG3_SHEWM|nr:hypothetical protein [Shewanella woodyi]ACA85961.1 hypothetical protein Swoo_1676 [Shewanella woodyi ATCC 51908]